MHAARRDGRIVAIMAPGRPVLIPTFKDRTLLHQTMRGVRVPYDQIELIADGPAFVAEALQGCVGATLEEGHGGAVLCLVIEVAAA